MAVNKHLMLASGLFFFSTLGRQTKLQVNPIVKKNIGGVVCGEVPPSLVHLHSIASTCFRFPPKEEKKSRMLPRLDLNLTPPSFILLFTGTFDDGHSSVIKHRDSCCIHCEPLAVPQSLLLSDSPFEELAVRPTTRKTHLTVSVCVRVD